MGGLGQRSKLLTHVLFHIVIKFLYPFVVALHRTCLLYPELFRGNNKMQFGDRIFYLRRGYYGELEECVGMVIRARGEGFDKTITYLDSRANLHEIKMMDVSDCETGNEVFHIEISERWAQQFPTYQYAAGLRLPVVAIDYSRSRYQHYPDLMVSKPDESKVEMLTVPFHLLCCGEEREQEVLRRAMLVLPGNDSVFKSGYRCAHQGKRRDALWRMADKAVHKLRDGKLKKLDERLGVL